MVWLKSCPRCVKGDMVPDEDGFRQCLHCGHTQYTVAHADVFSQRLWDMAASDNTPSPQGALRVQASAV